MSITKDRNPTSGISDQSEAEQQHTRKLRRETLRGRLIASFVAQQSAACSYLSFPDVAKHWALIRRENTLQAAKTAALADLMVGVLDGHIPELLYLHPKMGVEYAIGQPWCQDSECLLHDPTKVDEETAFLDSKKLKRMREIGPFDHPEAADATLLQQVAPYCWAPREAVVTFLRKRGVDSADLPANWYKELPGAGNKREPKRLAESDGAESISQVRPLSDREKTRIFADYRNTYSGTLPPTRDDDIAYMKQFGVGRDWVRKERSKFPNRSRGRNPAEAK